VPELRGTAGGALAAALLPGPYTLVLANPARRYPWLNGANPLAIGVRVPELKGDARVALDRSGAVVSTSANLHRGPAPATLAEVPEEIRAACAAVVDGGVLPGTPSTVIDFSGAEPRVLREGAAPSAPAIARALAAIL
jgi:tRNA A37 threonylcarbamoyladenosine synthetase subunit TsaC/SUA5/YrdC